MFLHSGASLHGHEYSFRRPSPGNQQPGNRRSPLLRSALASPISRSNTADGTRPALRLERRRLSENSPFPPPPEQVVRFQEPEVIEPAKPEPMSEDEASYLSEVSYSSDTPAAPRPRRRRRLPRKSTTYLFAHPAPKPRARRQLPIHIRPKLLLQLQQLSSSRRPRPYIDVFPSSLISGNVVAPRFSRRFPRIFGVKGELGLHDIIIVKSEDYDSHSIDTESDGEEEGLEKRELIAVISPRRRDDCAEIILDDGSVWVATQNSTTKSFDFTHTDEQGTQTTARWVHRNTPLPAFSPEPATPTISNVGPAGQSETKFTFSVINPLTRRHPIMGTLTQSTLEILDHYTTVSQSSGRYPPTRSMTRSSGTPTSPGFNPSRGLTSAPSSPAPPLDDDEGTSGLAATNAAPSTEHRTTCPIDDALKMLMTVTAVWVSTKHDWPTSAKQSTYASETLTPNVTLPPPPPTTVASAMQAAYQHRVSPRRNCSPQSEDSPTPEPGMDQYSTSNPVVPGIASRPTALRKGQTMPITPRSREPSPAPSLSFARIPILPRRATSTGAAFMQRRMQVQSSDASDSERGVTRRRGKGRRVLSGDFGLRSRPSPAAMDVPDLVRDNDTPSPAAREQQPIEALAPAPQKPLTVRHGRAQSAYYPFNPARVGDVSPIVAHHEMDFRGGIGHGNVTEDEYDDPGNTDKSARWKKFGNWFRRLGGR